MKPIAKLFDPKYNNIVILSIILVLSLVWAIYYYLSQPPEDIPGSLRVVCCRACGAQSIERIVDITDNQQVCPTCGGRLGYAYKCQDCDFEYCYLPSTAPPGSERGRTLDFFNAVVNMTKCPNCGSTHTAPVGIKEFKKK